MITNKKYQNRSVLKYRSSISAFIFLFLLSGKISGQVQANFLETLTDKFQKYCSSFPREEIYVHTDRQEYVAGEDLWFKIYLIDRKSAKPSSESKIAYFEILNSENRPVVQNRIKLDKGFGPGQILLPDTIRSGNYTLRAYTNWMKNFMPYNCFSKTLKIYNALNGKSFNGNSESVSAISKSGKRDMSTGHLESEFNVDINNNKQESIELVISASKNYRAIYGNICFLFVQTHGVINYKSIIGLSGDINRIEIPRNQLIPGINHITLFNASGKPAKERFIYTPMKEANSMTIASSGSFKTRDKISLGVDIRNGSATEADSPNLSISVAPAGLDKFPDIDDYMIFGSEFGVLPSEIPASGLNDSTADTLDSFLSGIKSNWIDWNTILSGNFPVLKYRKEVENHFLYGRLINKNSQDPDGEQYLFLSMPGKNATFQYAKTDENGNFIFTIPLDNKIKDLIIQPEKTDRNDIIKIETSFSEKYTELVPVKDNSLEKLPQALSKLGINYQVMKIYKSDEIPAKPAPVVFTGGSQRFYGKPDIELNMDDYIKLPVMQEVFFELLPGVFLKKKKAEYEITIMDPIENMVYFKPPLLLIDGVIIKDPAVIANLDPELVEKIDAVKSRYIIGEYMFYGLVNVITRAGDFSNITLPDYAVRLPYRITEPVNTFLSPDYSLQEKRQNRIPDFRNTLYWNSSVEPDKDGKASIGFWGSDIDSEYEVSIQGFTGTGIPVSAKKNFRLLRKSDP